MRIMARPFAPDGDTARDAWLRPAALGLVALALASAVLDRRNGLTDETAGATRAVEAPPTAEALLREMLTHD